MRAATNTTKPKPTPPAKAGKAPKPKKSPAPRSRLEVGWIREWDRQGGPVLVEEFQFHAVRKWRADFAHMETRTLIEIEGGAAGGRHTRVQGFRADLDKYLTAALHGWEVLRIGAHQVRGDIVAAVIGRVLQKSAEAFAGHPGKSAEASGAAAVRVEGQDSAGGPVWLTLGADGLKIEFGP